MTTMNKDFALGSAAFTAGKSRDDNPWDADKAGASRNAAYAWWRGWDHANRLAFQTAIDTLPSRLETCAKESEQGRNFAATPHTCREAAERIVALEECLRRTRFLVSQAAVTKGFADEDTVRQLYGNNGAITRLVPVKPDEREASLKMVQQAMEAE